jgi:hypothetical protein
MSDHRRPFANEDDEAQYHLSILRSGDAEQKLESRERLSQIFEARGMLAEACELLEGNARAGLRSRTLFTRLASLYRRTDRHDDADAAMAEAASLMGSAPPGRAQPTPVNAAPTPMLGAGVGPTAPRVNALPSTPKKRSTVKTLGIGCLGCGGLIVIAFVIMAAIGSRAGTNTATQPPTAPQTAAQGEAQSKPQQSQAAAPKAAEKQVAEPTTLPSVGEALERNNWLMKLEKVETAATLKNVLGEKKAQGLFVVLTMSATNRSKQTTVLNGWDFKLSTPDGTKYDSSSDGSSALTGEPRPIILADQIQPGLTRSFRQVFDVNPSSKVYILEAAGARFQISLP